ncbi:MAG: SDR family oxidoreductase [Gammaproteobacteria bacterium]|nr:SDR family oxidoreductase [Gammaproteobacteria bacterium]
MNFSGKTVLVTGANRGIGLAIVKSLLKKDVGKVYAAVRDVRNRPDFDDTRVIPLTLDITNKEQIAAAAKAAGDVDVLINNAGVAAFSSILDGPLDLVERDMKTNYFGTLDMVRTFVPVLEGKEGAAIVNIVTIAAFASFPIVGGYSASKAALFSLSQGIRIELASKRISVHTVNPGPIDTELARDFPTDKADPGQTADNIITGLENDEADIFPDAMGQQMFDVWKSDYRGLERMVHDMHYAD